MRSFGKSLLSRRIVIAVLGGLLVVGLGYAYWDRSRRRPRPEGCPHELPGGCPEDQEKAEKHPDAYAWDLFLAINRQALPGKRGVPDPSKPTIKENVPGEPVVWETWARSSGGRFKGIIDHPNFSEVFLDMGRTPVPWDQLGKPDKYNEPARLKQVAGLLEETADEQNFRNAAKRDAFDSDLRMLIEPTIAGDESGIGEEVRMNRANYEFVIANNLYNLEGLEAAFTKPAGTQDPRCPAQNINAPPEAQEIKAMWSRISESEKPRYHWRELESNGKKEIWGLTALHITTKDLCNWFWCDFEHVDFLALPNHSLDPALGRKIERAELPSRDSTVSKDVNILNRVRPETAGTPWANYRLRGTQIDFVEKIPPDCKETPTLLANTEIEKGFQQTSSCITCHARATIGIRSSQNQFNAEKLGTFLSREPILVGYIGKPQPDWFIQDGKKYIQTDFMWSFAFRAQSTIATPTPSPSPTPTPSPTPCR